ncbi:MAG TPA: DUF4389 domain-containing protein [Egibacteraceae bacterium]|nr:DUF4389 domain-containing protein [Egibacteraceae bacterium]
MTAGKIVALVSGLLIGLAALGVAATGVGMVGVYAVDRDADGFLTSPEFTLSSSGHAVTTEEVDLQARPGDWVPWVGTFDVRVTVESTRSGDDIFVGIAEVDDVRAYLEGVPRDEVTRLDDRGARYRTHQGSATPAPPARQDFWDAAASGPRTQTVRWSLTPGRWALVVMNADAGADVDVTATAGIQSSLMLPVGLGLLVGALVLGAAAAALLVVALARTDATEAVAPSRRQGVPAPADRVYPLVLTGALDEPLSRWMWLVKWILAIPHFVVLAFLWLAFVVLTAAAGVAILFTGRYPRGIFDFNVGVLRWTWRVAFYVHGALATDRYPPFAFDAPDYPAQLDVTYPSRLSRGLVLVKWWLLALPHYLVVAILAGGGTAWSAGQGNEQAWPVMTTGGGLIGLLVLIAGVVLLFTARYPRALFELVMGLNRWVYRVIAYAALMTDVYPPFRLDPGGGEPAPVPLPQAPDAGSDRMPVTTG